MRARGKRSKFEARVSDALGPTWDYEKEVLPYTLNNRYIPDFTRATTLVEAKGRFTGTDRRKMLAAKAANPKWDFRIVFMRNNPIYKGSKTTYMDWAAKHGFRASVFPELPLASTEVTTNAKKQQPKARCVVRR